MVFGNPPHFNLMDLDFFGPLTDYVAIDKWVTWGQTVSMLSGEGQQCATLSLESMIKGDKLWPIWEKWLTLVQTLSWPWLAG